MSTSSLLITLSAFTLATSFISGVLGMAGGMLLMAGLLTLMPVASAMVLHGITQFVSNAWRAVLWREAIEWRRVGGYGLGAVIAALAFVTMQVSLSRPLVLLVLGVTPFAMLCLPRRLELNIDHRNHALIAGVASTAVQLLAGVSGPLLDSFFVRSAMNRKSVVATKAAIQVLGHGTKTLYFAAVVGVPDINAIAVSLMALFAIIGTTASRTVLEWLSDSTFRVLTRVCILVISAGCLASGVMSLLCGT